MNNGNIHFCQQTWELISNVSILAGFGIEESIAISDQSYRRIITDHRQNIEVPLHMLAALASQISIISLRMGRGGRNGR